MLMKNPLGVTPNIRENKKFKREMFGRSRKFLIFLIQSQVNFIQIAIYQVLKRSKIPHRNASKNDPSTTKICGYVAQTFFEVT